jgi:hypothetical protein
MSLVDRVAEALWIANEPWRQPGPFTAVVQPPWEHADDMDRELYRIKAQVIIDHLGLDKDLNELAQLREYRDNAAVYVAKSKLSGWWV